MKKPAWQSMPVLDVFSLSREQLGALSATYDSVSNDSVSKDALQPIAQLASDPTRISIDDALCAELSLPSLAPIRELMVREPGLTG